MGRVILALCGVIFALADVLIVGVCLRAGDSDREVKP